MGKGGTMGVYESCEKKAKNLRLGDTVEILEAGDYHGHCGVIRELLATDRENGLLAGAMVAVGDTWVAMAAASLRKVS